MIMCVIQYTIDPHAIEDFEKYAATWPPIIERCGGELTGYYLQQLGQVEAGRRSADAGQPGQFPRGQRAVGHERAQHRGPGRIRNQGGGLGDVRVVRDGPRRRRQVTVCRHGHGSTVAQAYFDVDRSIAARPETPTRSLRERQDRLQF